MDLNYLFLRQQVERSLAEAAKNEAARRSHEQLARAYEVEIERKSGGRIRFRARAPKGLVRSIGAARDLPSASSRGRGWSS